MRWRPRRVLAVLGLFLMGGWLVAGLCASWFLVSRRTPQTPEVAPVRTADEPFEEVRLCTEDGYELGAWFVRPQQGRRRAAGVLFLHGYGERRTLSNVAMTRAAQHGYAAMNLSFRGHGDSSGHRTDLGWSDSADVVLAVEFMQERLPGQPILIVATSMGAAAAIFAAAELGERVSGYWLNAPYRDLETAAWNRCRRDFPPLLDRLAYLGLRLWTPLWLEADFASIRPIDHLNGFPESCQVVFTVGEHDVETPVEDVRALVEACSASSRLLVYEGVGHEGLKAHDFERYMEGVLAFLDDVVE